MKMRLYIFLFVLLFALPSCSNERTACDCMETIEGVLNKVSNKELPLVNMTEAEIDEKYLKGCEWIKEVNDDVLADELKNCLEYIRKEE